MLQALEARIAIDLVHASQDSDRRRPGEPAIFALDIGQSIQVSLGIRYSAGQRPWPARQRRTSRRRWARLKPLKWHRWVKTSPG
ncbi:hypothetical protein C266_04084 [Pandoraea sp. SD6-2]|nr:hypothetical protein C266_04084 [Pandoraea sp. SD6-2]